MNNHVESERRWKLIDTINALAAGEGWCMVVFADGMAVIDTDDDAPDPKYDPFDYVESRAAQGSLLHIIAHGTHGLILTEDDDEDIPRPITQIPGGRNTA